MYRTIGPDFCWATGIENTFIPHVRPGLRALDQYALTQHDDHWRADLDQAAALGVQAIRWGIFWYRVQPKPETKIRSLIIIDGDFALFLYL